MKQCNAGRRTFLGWSLTLATAALISTAGAGPAEAQSLEERAMGEGLRVAFYNFKPYAYMNEDGKLVGEQVDILRHVVAAMGGRLASEQATEWGNLIPGVNARRFDVVAAGMFVTPKRCAAVRFSEPTFGIQQSLVVPKGNPEGIVDYDSIRDKGLIVAAISGAAQVGYAERSGIDAAKIMQLPDNPTAIAALRAGRAAVYALSAPGARELVAGLPEQDMETVPAFDTVAGERAIAHGAYAFRKEDGAFVDEFDKHLTAFIGTPEHIAIMEKHGMSAEELPKSRTAELCGE